jgi:hypothetical protein
MKLPEKLSPSDPREHCHKNQRLSGYLAEIHYFLISNLKSSAILG